LGPITRCPRSAAAPGSPPCGPGAKPEPTPKGRTRRPRRRQRPRLPRRGRGTRSGKRHVALRFAPKQAKCS
jgi:hypothetical protein